MSKILEAARAALKAAGLDPDAVIKAAGRKAGKGKADRFPPACFSSPAWTDAPIILPVSNCIRAAMIRAMRGGLIVGGSSYSGVVSAVNADPLCSRSDWVCSERNMRSAFTLIHSEYGFGFRYDPKTDKVFILGTPADGWPKS